MRGRSSWWRGWIVASIVAAWPTAATAEGNSEAKAGPARTLGTVHAEVALVRLTSGEATENSLYGFDKSVGARISVGYSLAPWVALRASTRLAKSTSSFVGKTYNDFGVGVRLGLPTPHYVFFGDFDVFSPEVRSDAITEDARHRGLVGYGVRFGAVYGARTHWLFGLAVGGGVAYLKSEGGYSEERYTEWDVVSTYAF